MAYASLGRKNLAARAPGRFTPRVCPICGERKTPRAFQLKRFRSLSLICSTCLQTKKAQVTELMRSRIYPLKQHRRRIVEIVFRHGERRLARISAGKEVNTLTPEDYALKVAKLPDRVAAIIGKTFVVMGDAATIEDDEALSRIRDLVLEIDESLIARNKDKRLARGRS